jgi:uncharacterized protein (TIGR03066 family)
MTRAFAVLVGLLAVGFVLTAPSLGQDEAAKLVGRWEAVKADELPPGSVIEFAKDGKLNLLVKEKTGDLKFDGTYTVAGTKVTIKLKAGDATVDETVTITKLTATELNLEDKDKKTNEFKRK